jgi:hypothetical protein
VPSITDPQTRAALAEIGCLSEDKLDTTAMARLLAERLEADHIAVDLDAVPTVETTAGQLVTALVGVDDEEVVEAAKQLLQTGANGRVQKALTNGYVMCGRRARIDVNIAGEHQTLNVTTRFLSGDKDVIQRYVLDPRQKTVESFLRSTKELTALIEVRQPDMGARIGGFLERLNVTWQKELALPRDDEDDEDDDLTN